MKKIKPLKLKLKLNSETIRMLDEGKLLQVDGGALNWPTFGPACTYRGGGICPPVSELKCA